MNESVRNVKAVVLGNTAVGKTSLIQAVCFDEMANAEHLPTIGASLLKFTYQADGFDAVIHFWDTAGQEKFHSLVPMYLKHSHICYLVFALNNLKSFDDLEKWTNQIREILSNVPIILIGNKSDVEEQPPLISNDQIEMAKERFGFANYQRTSAVDLTGVQEIVRGNIELIWRDSLNFTPGVRITSIQTRKGCC
jgi:small GTP-binding protein